MKLTTAHRFHVLTVLAAVCLALCSEAIFAKPVEDKTALQVAEAWLTANPAPGTKDPHGNTRKAKRARHFKDKSGHRVAYIVDLDPQGYVIVPADDTVEPIFCFSPTGRFTGTHEPCNHLSLMLSQDIPDYIKQHGKAPKSYRDKLAEKWGRLKKAGEILEMTDVVPSAVSIEAFTTGVGPLIADQWGQSGSSPTSQWTYNLYTPNHYVTGCVATSMAMIIHFNRYPGYADGSGTIFVNGWPQSASFASHYNYLEMPTKLRDTSTLGEIQQVARLQYDCGISVSMYYAWDGSGAYVQDVATALRNDFGYTDTKWKNGTDSDWRTVLKTELDQGYPVQMAIRAGDSVGHSIICDGWGADGGGTTYYHLNMGWDGSWDNWYYVPGFSAGGYYWSTMKGFVYDAWAPSKTIRVKAGTNAAHPSGASWSMAYNTIGEAMRIADWGDNVWVAAGTYNENVVTANGVNIYGGFAGTETSLTQRHPRNNVTIIDGQQNGRAISLINSLLSGFTIRNGRADVGGGILCTGNYTWVSDNIITGNTATSQGGAIRCYGGKPAIRNNLIYGNTSDGTGGGIYCEGVLTTSYIHTNTVAKNTAASGGGIALIGNGPAVSNNIVALNSSGIYASGNSSILTSNCVAANTGYNYSGISPGATDIQQDPLLVDPNGGNFHIPAWSPCVDHGTNAAPPGESYLYKDMDWQDRVNNSVVDIGADENWGEYADPVIYVKHNSPNDGPGTDWAHAYHTITQALAAANPGQQVWVAAGTYTERINLKSGIPVYGGFAGTETSVSDRDPKANVTIIDGNRGGTVVTSTTGVGPSTRLDGFTIRNGMGPASGGVYCYDSSPVISNNTITGNESLNNGGGASFYLSGARLENNIIAGNTAVGTGGGVECVDCSPTIIGNTVYGNQAVSGGGIGFLSTAAGLGSPKLTNNTIFGNTATSSGGGIVCDQYASPMISNNIVAFNSSGIWKHASSTPTLRNNDVHGNTGYQYSGLAAGTGDISTDPQFASRISNDLHIRPTSPCRNAGLSTADGITGASVDMDAQARIEGTAVDIGADESYSEAYSAIHRVKYNSTTDGPGDAWSRAWRSVATALSYALPGDEVWVAAGAYNGRFTLKSGVGLYGGFAGTEIKRSGRNMQANTTTLNARGEGCVVTVQEPAHASTAIEGFTITGGAASAGAGIRCRSGSTPTINANIIIGNTGEAGSGIFCGESDAVITNNVIQNNFGSGAAGGIYCENCEPRIINNVIVGNEGPKDMGGAIGIVHAAPVIQNNIILGNIPGIWSDREIRPQWNCFWENDGYDCAPAKPDETNLRRDPLFVDAAAGDYHLRSSSPCIESGWHLYAPQMDKDGSMRPQDADGDGAAACDIGAYESVLDLASVKKSYADGAQVKMGGVSVTAVFRDEDMIYVEKPDRSAGIRVYANGVFQQGQIVNVIGNIDTGDATGERAIWAQICQVAGGTFTPQPLRMTIRNLGGGPLGLQQGVDQGAGLNNIGLLVKVTGRLEGIGTRYVSLDDGSGVSLRVFSPVDLTFPPGAYYATVTGVVSCGKKSTGTLYRAIKPRGIADIVVH